jgi:hypothetical protein
MDFGLKDVKFIPEIDEIPINPNRLKKIIEDCVEYNLASRQYKKYDSSGGEIPERYRGRNRYWLTAGEGHHELYGDYPIISLYDLDPEALDGRVLICKYRPERPAQKTTTGEELHAVPLQTLAQAEKQIRAAQLEAERQERMAKKDSKLVSEIKIKIPTMMAPTAARRRISESQK